MEKSIENKDLNCYMTSELLYIYRNNKDNEFGKRAASQLFNRLKYCKCTAEMMDAFLQRESLVLNYSEYSKIRTLNYPINQGEYGICGYNWWKEGKTIYNGNIMNMASSMDFTISEIISITDRAEYLVVYENENEAISDSLFSELFILSEKGKQTILLNKLVAELLHKGWQMENIDLLFRNEFSIIMKYRYNRQELNPFE